MSELPEVAQVEMEVIGLLWLLLQLLIIYEKCAETLARHSKPPWTAPNSVAWIYPSGLYLLLKHCSFLQTLVCQLSSSRMAAHVPPVTSCLLHGPAWFFFLHSSWVLRRDLFAYSPSSD